jgi:hypothetical protein
VDTTTPEDLAASSPQVEEYGPHVIDGHRVQWREEVSTDADAGVRNWRVSLRLDDEPINFERKSHYVPHAKFVKVLEDAGLDVVGPVEIPGERYAVFIGRRPLD